jgi:beta-galactosidase
MGCPGKNLTAIFFTLFLFVNFSYGQITFKELPRYELKQNDALFFDLSRSRSIISLNGNWSVFPADDADNKTSVTVPSIFKGTGELIFQKHFRLTAEQVNQHNLRLFFSGLNYSADISVNNVIIYRHTGGEFPFNFVLPRDILHADKNNVLSVKLNYELDSENTIPVKQRFLYPQSFGGIIRDVYLKLMPNISLSEINISRVYNPRSNSANIKVEANVENREFRKNNDTTAAAGQSFTLRTSVISPGGMTGGSTGSDFELKINRERNISQSIGISSPLLWSPSDPKSYTVKVELWQGDRLIDVSESSLAIYSLNSENENLSLNGSNFTLNGTTFVPCYYEYGSLASYSGMERDIRLIKEAGFNSVRFINNVPHPYYLQLCEQYGLLAFIELPLSSVPENLVADSHFITRSRNYINDFIKGYGKYSAVAAIGLGCSYNPNLEKHIEFLSGLASIVKKSTTCLTYASFAGFDVKPVSGLDLYGVELLNTPVYEAADALKSLKEKMGAGHIMISAATYVVNKGSSDGYVNEGSFESQAKHYEELLDYTAENPLAGYFINTMFDYRGDFASLISGYNSDNIYYIGIAGEDRNTNRIAYKVISAKLHNTENVTIPIGSKRDTSPMMFIVFGLVLALFMGVLVNSGRKFREDSSRALLRPYNFFADVRDQRIMSGPHTTILMLVIAAVAALVTSNLLSYIRESVFFEKIALSFGSQKLMQVLSYLAWNPVLALIWLTAGFIFMMVVLTIIVKAGSFFVRNRVYFSSVYFTVIWSFLPLVLLIPAGIVLFRVLNAGTGNMYIFVGLVVFAVWIFYRLMKGIYVIFDVNAGSVYFYSLLVVLFIIGGTLFYYEITNSVVGYLQLTIKQFNPGI